MPRLKFKVEICIHEVETNLGKPIVIYLAKKALRIRAICTFDYSILGYMNNHAGSTLIKHCFDKQGKGKKSG